MRGENWKDLMASELKCLAKRMCHRRISWMYCTGESHESTRHYESNLLLLTKTRSSHYRTKDFTSMNHCNLVHKFIPMPQVMKTSGCESCSGQGIEKARDNSSMALLEKVKSKKEVIVEAQRDKKNVHFASLMDICHLKNAALKSKLQKYKDRVVLRGDIVKDDSGAYVVVSWTGLVCVPNACRKSNGCYWKDTTTVTDKQLM